MRAAAETVLRSQAERGDIVRRGSAVGNRLCAEGRTKPAAASPSPLTSSRPLHCPRSQQEAGQQ